MTLVIVTVVAVPGATSPAFALAITVPTLNIYSTLNVAFAIAAFAIRFDNTLAYHAVVG
ncbi:hypothetical protein [Phyllobacterium zundukense]|uniref:Uncharacterized protein n=2 Tax=Phyllobacterium zundukense TaxID=1867719 RepID=A0ACD4CZ91_9HYPH|nr:hypothetical protein [Phyllobacterium zundukense]UXN58637.1 hypothetical protein N8E88_11645 [Phyllobacterium zundukense]UXN58773.1 hypothetical protein N8E88_07545 [Phyllobacterium zundukense]